MTTTFSSSSSNTVYPQSLLTFHFQHRQHDLHQLHRHALAAFSVFASGAMGGVVAIPPELELDDRSMAASTIELKFWDSLECTTSVHQKTYNSGDCLNVAGRRAVSMQKRSSGDCYITRYHPDDCSGHGESGYNLHDCFSVKGDWTSLKIRC